MLTHPGVESEKASPTVLPAENVVVETRFGVYEFAPQNTIIMPRGLVGFPDLRLFGLGNLPEPVPAAFMLLQALGEPALSFVVMPSSPAEAPLETRDLEEACAATGFLRDDVLLLFICTVRKKDGSQEIEMSVNLRAPILCNLDAQQARQYILNSDHYPLREPLDRLAKAVNAG